MGSCFQTNKDSRKKHFNRKERKDCAGKSFVFFVPFVVKEVHLFCVCCVNTLESKRAVTSTIGITRS